MCRKSFCKKLKKKDKNEKMLNHVKLFPRSVQILRLLAFKELLIINGSFTINTLQNVPGQSVSDFPVKMHRLLQYPEVEHFYGVILGEEGTGHFHVM